MSKRLNSEFNSAVECCAKLVPLINYLNQYVTTSTYKTPMPLNQSAEKEIAFWFGESKLIGRKLATNDWTYEQKVMCASKGRKRHLVYSIASMNTPSFQDRFANYNTHGYRRCLFKKKNVRNTLEIQILLLAISAEIAKVKMQSNHSH